MEQNDLLEIIKILVGFLKKEMKEKKYKDEFIKEVVESFENDYQATMESNAKRVYDLFRYGVNQLNISYTYDDFDEDDIYYIYATIINCIVKYALSFIRNIKTFYEFEFDDGQIFRFDCENINTITTPLKQLYKEAGIEL